MKDLTVVASEGDVQLALHLGHEHAESSSAPVDDPFEPDPDPRPIPTQVRSTSLLLLHRGEYVGVLSWLPVLHGPSYPCTAWMIGAMIMPAQRGRGLGAASQRLLAQHLFATTDLDRVEAETDVDNMPNEKRCGAPGSPRKVSSAVLSCVVGCAAT